MIYDVSVYEGGTDHIGIYGIFLESVALGKYSQPQSGRIIKRISQSRASILSMIWECASNLLTKPCKIT